jgi:hypothetical protein
MPVAAAPCARHGMRVPPSGGCRHAPTTTHITPKQINNQQGAIA